MELIEIVDIVTAEYSKSVPDVRFDMNRYKRNIELSTNKEQKIKDVIAGLNYKTCLIGMAYQANNYSLGCTNDFTNVNSTVARYYYNKQDFIKKMMKGDLSTIIEEDVRCFWKTYCIEVELRGMLLDAEKKGVSNQSEHKTTINVEDFKSYFSLHFKGGGNGSINYFEWLIRDLQVQRSDKEFACIALVIYNGNKLMPSKKPSTFAAWYRIFCDLIKCKYHRDYKPCNLALSKENRDKYSYLF